MNSRTAVGGSSGSRRRTFSGTWQISIAKSRILSGGWPSYERQPATSLWPKRHRGAQSLRQRKGSVDRAAPRRVRDIRAVGRGPWLSYFGPSSQQNMRRSRRFEPIRASKPRSTRREPPSKRAGCRTITGLSRLHPSIGSLDLILLQHLPGFLHQFHAAEVDQRSQDLAVVFGQDIVD